MDLENIKKAKVFYKTLTSIQKAKLYNSYNKVSAFIPSCSFLEWLSGYMDLPYILKSMYL